MLKIWTEVLMLSWQILLPTEPPQSMLVFKCDPIIQNASYPRMTIKRFLSPLYPQVVSWCALPLQVSEINEDGIGDWVPSRLVWLQIILVNKIFPRLCSSRMSRCRVLVIRRVVQTLSKAGRTQMLAGWPWLGFWRAALWVTKLLP